MMIVADKEVSLVLTGTGDVLEPEAGVMGIGSGGNYALAAARALMDGRSMPRRSCASRSISRRHLRLHQPQRHRGKTLSIESEDIDAAITAGVMPQAQADALRASWRNGTRGRASRRGRGTLQLPDGFNDFFFAVGILFAVWDDVLRGCRSVAEPGRRLIIWALAELLVRRMRLLLPGILLA